MMTKRQYEAKLHLDKVRNINKEVVEARQKVEEYEAYVLSVKSMFSDERVDTGKYKKNVIEEKVIKLIEKKDALKLLEKKLEDAKKEIKCLIDSINDSNINKVMVMRYLEFKTWEDISNKLSFTTRWVMKLDKKGLNKVSDLLQ